VGVDIIQSVTHRSPEEVAQRHHHYAVHGYADEAVENHEDSSEHGGGREVAVPDGTHNRDDEKKRVVKVPPLVRGHVAHVLLQGLAAVVAQFSEELALVEGRARVGEKLLEVPCKKSFDTCQQSQPVVVPPSRDFSKLSSSNRLFSSSVSTMW
jgi:hypothetical protein